MGQASRAGRVIVTVMADGLVNAETRGILGESCLDYIAILEDLIAGRVVSSQYTADFTRGSTEVEFYQEDRGVEHA